MSRISCHHPRLIFNPNLPYLASTSVCVHLGDNIVSFTKRVYVNTPWKIFYSAKNSVNEDNLGDYFFVDENGVRTPVFIYVPCGKCDLCLDRKVKDWETRCICESASHAYPPYFITLTYRPEDRPRSVCKEDCQKFLKRLRINIERDLGVKSSIRYLLVSEYTPKNHYPHYHMLLWGMPYIAPADGDRFSCQRLKEFIEDAWSHGFIKLERCRDESGAYCLKYMRKGSIVPHGLEDCFLLSSRRRGIGYSWCAANLTQIRRCLDITSLSILTKNGVVNRPIPAYFKRVWFPTMSQLMPTKISKALHDYFNCASSLYHFCVNRFGFEWLSNNILDNTTYVVEKYPIVKIDFCDFQPTHAFVQSVCRHDGLECVDRLDPFSYEFRRNLINMFLTYKDSLSVLSQYTYDLNLWKSLLELHDSRTAVLSLVTQELPDIDYDARQHKIDVDKRWIYSHWMQQEIG